MSEIKDNTEIQEVKPYNLCCTCQNGQTVITNKSQCKEKCCTPKDVVCPDIRDAKCMPALIDRIYDCICLENEQTRCAKNKIFEITWTRAKNKADLVGKEVCIKTITLQYDCLGIKEEKIATDIGLSQDVELKHDECPQCCDYIFTEYSNSIVCVGTGCCENGRYGKVCQTEITPGSCNLSIIVEGTADCIPFKAEYIVKDLTNGNSPAYGPGPGPGPKPDTGLGFKDVDFFGQICLPDDRKKVTLRAIFDVCLSVPCVAPKGVVKEISGPKDVNEIQELEENETNTIVHPPTPKKYVFDANIFAALLVTEKLYVVAKDEVAVYTTPNRLSCTNGGFTLNCESEC